MAEKQEKQETQALLSSPGNAYSEEDSLENGDAKKPNGGVPSAKEPHTFDQKISGKAWGRVLQFRKLREFPFSVFFIVGNEFCERFSYYGMRAVLVLFLTTQLDFNDDSATAYYHAFIMLCYFSPLLGAIISDSCLGKYKTILILSVVYAVGNVTVSVSAIPFDRWLNILLVMVGLFIIAFGTGGIKPCVSSFGGDQFGEDQKNLLRRFFSLFYFSINAGSVISTLLTPVLRSQVQCFGSDQCFPLAFGVPAILMVISIFIFIAGTRYYINKKPSKEQALLFIDVPVSVVVAISRRIKLGKQPGKKNFMQYATPKYSETFVDDVWLLLRVLVMFLPLPIFWTLFDQQGSRWTLQAVRMNGRLGDITIQPDQIQALNPILILVFIPIFELIIYPVFAKCHLLKKPLQRMVAGMVFAGLAFVVAGVVQLQIQSSMETLRGGEAKLVITNELTDTVQLQLDGSIPFNLSYEYPYLERTKSLGDHNLTVTRLNGETDQTSFHLSSEHIYQIVMTTAEDGSLVFAHTDFEESLPDGDKASIRVINAVHVDGPNDTLNFTLCKKKSCSNTEFTVDELDFLSTSDQSDVDIGKYYYRIEINTTNISGEAEFTQITSLGVRLDGGGIYTMVIAEAEENVNNDTYKVTVTEIDPPNEVSIFLQVPMYVLITAGEVMFSITGLEFAYSQAPSSMKAICQAAWLWTVAFGNLFVVIVAEGSIFSDQAIEFFFFAVCITAVAILFAVMSYFYKYVDISKRGQEDASEQQHNESSSLVTQDDPSPGEDGRGTNYTMEAKEDTLLRQEDTDPSESEL